MAKKLLFPILLLLSAGLSLWLPSCKPREEELQTSGGLEFSADTVKFDTVFTTLRTITKRLWVYNRNPKGVTVDLISLDKPASSPYTLLINGDLKQTANNLFIRGQDSLLILVRAQLKDSGQNGAAKDYVQNENLNFRTNGQDQHVLLRSFGQNIYLHNHVVLPTGTTTWTNDRPHLLYDTVVVPMGSTLRIKPGTRIYAHAGALLLVLGTLRVNDPLDYDPGLAATDTIKATNANIVRFTGDRYESNYLTAPGQWKGIALYPSSHDNLIRYAQIQNAAFGVLLLNPKNLSQQPDVTIQNSIIRYISGSNASFAGTASSRDLPGAAILSIAGNVTLENTLLSDCYEHALLAYGGTYSLNYCTVANYPVAQFPATSVVRTLPSLFFSNLSADMDNPNLRYPLKLNLYNSIVWGSMEDEVLFDKYDDYKSAVDIRNTLLRTRLYAATADAAGKPGLSQASFNNVINDDPKFLKIYTGGRDDYRLGDKSPALDRATQQVAPFIARDLLNLLRNPSHPDLGAYQTTK